MNQSESDTGIADPFSVFGVEGRVAIVTGASSGLGAHFARVLHGAGARVALTARRADRLGDLAREVPGSVVIAADVSSADDRERIVSKTVEALGAPRILVNNAGIGNKVAVEDEDIETFRRAMEVNVTALWHLSKLCAPYMRAAGSGRIINVASMFGIVGSAPIKQAHYCASKGAVINLTRELALQWARKGITVNALCPGWFPSEMTEGMTDESSLEYLQRNAPIPRMGELRELNGALLLLASDASSFMTGQQLVVDGGWTAR
ncbi:MAG: SDR family NAD(P)-dependent oxidoreductase [Actinomycetota bacterium]